MSYAVTSCNST